MCAVEGSSSMFLRALRLARATVEIPGLTAAAPRPRGPRSRWAAGRPRVARRAPSCWRDRASGAVFRCSRQRFTPLICVFEQIRATCRAL